MVRSLTDAQAAAVGAERVELRNCTRTGEIARIAVEDVPEDHVEPGDEAEQRDGDGGADYEQETASQTETAHRSMR